MRRRLATPSESEGNRPFHPGKSLHMGTGRVLDLCLILMSVTPPVASAM